MIRTKGFLIWSNGDPSVGDHGKTFELICGAETEFEDEEEVREFTDAIVHTIGAHFNEKFHARTLEEQEKMEEYNEQ